jgi:hypothetical protein
MLKGFSAQEAAVLAAAYDEACRRAKLSEEESFMILRQAMAERIVALARQGEFDREKLVTAALQVLGNG